MSDEEAEDGVDGDYGDVQPEENDEQEEEEEGGADYLSDDEPRTNVGAPLEQDEFQSDLQQQLDDRLSSHLTAEPQYETLDHDEVCSIDQHEIVQHEHEVHGMDHVVQEVSNVDQLVNSMGTISAHQIEISDMTDPTMGDVESTVGMVDAQQMLEDMEVAADDPQESIGADGVAEADLSGDCAGLDAIATAAAEAAMEGAVTTPQIEAEVNSAETNVAERGPDMPII